MIEQLWYTWSSIGLGGGTGFRVRAASSGLTDIRGIRFQQLDAHLRYDLPPGVNHYNVDAASMPRCLALLDTPNERIIVHKAYVGKDDYGRPGVFFCHLLAGLSKDIPANAIIELWGSPFWQMHDPEENTSTELPLVDLNNIIDGTLTDADLPAIEIYLPAVIYAFFALEESQKLYIAARDEQVAALILGLTRCLPRPLQQFITFSTYETDILASPALIVGTDAATPEDLPRDFPQEYQSTAGFAINCKAAPTLLPEQHSATAYANFVMACLKAGDTSCLFTLLEAAEKCQIQDKATFLTFTEITVAIEEGHLTPSRVLSVLRHPVLASYYLGHEDVQELLLQEALTNPVWWQQYAAGLLKKLTQYQNQSKQLIQALQDLSRRVTQRAIGAFEHADANLWCNLVLILEVTTIPEHNPGPWLRLLNHHTTILREQNRHATTFCKWEWCLYMLQRWTHLQQPIDPDLLQPWLPGGWVELKEFLGLAFLFPHSWQREALTQLLRATDQQRIPYPKDLAGLIGRYSNLFLSTLETLWKQTHERETVLRFFAATVESAPHYKLNLLAKLLKKERLTDQDIVDLLQCAHLTSFEAPTVATDNAETLLSFVHISMVQDIFQQYCESYMQAWKSPNETDHFICSRLVERYKLFPQPFKQSLSDFSIIVFPDWRDTPTEQLREKLKNDVEVLQGRKLFQQDRYKDWLCDYLLWHTIRFETRDENFKRLHYIVATFAPHLTGNRHEMLRVLAAHLGRKYTADVSFSRLRPFLRVVLSYVEKERATGEEAIKQITIIYRALLENASKEQLQRFDQEIPTGFHKYTLLVEGYEHWRQEQKELKQGGAWFSNPFKKRDTGTVKAVKPAQAPGHPEKKPSRPSQASSQPMAMKAPTSNSQDTRQDLAQKVMQLKSLYISYRLDEIENIKKHAKSKQQGLPPTLKEEEGLLDQLNDARIAEQAVQNTLIPMHESVIQALADPTKVHPTSASMIESQVVTEYEIVTNKKSVRREIKQLTSKEAQKTTHLDPSDIQKVISLFLRLRFFASALARQNVEYTLARWYEEHKN